MAFGSTYVDEAAMSHAEWLNRVTAWDGDRGVRYMAVQDEETPCGSLGACLSQNDSRVADLVSMWVAPSHRGQGLAARLIDAVRRWAEDRHVHQLRLSVVINNVQAIRLYERMGFVASGLTFTYPNDPALLEQEMIWFSRPAPK